VLARETLGEIPGLVGFGVGDRLEVLEEEAGEPDAGGDALADWSCEGLGWRLLVFIYVKLGMMFIP
jgi:hypothetical protein